jgi:hypothetical protein
MHGYEFQEYALNVMLAWHVEEILNKAVILVGGIAPIKNVP